MDRDESIDIVRGILILLVVAGHIPNLSGDIHIDYLISLIYSFHVPGFFLISGYLYAYSKKSIAKTLNHIVKPYVVGSLLLLVFGTIANVFLSLADSSKGFNSNSFIDILSGHAPGAMWFLWALAIMQAVILVVEKSQENTLGSVEPIITILVYLPIGYALGCCGLNVHADYWIYYILGYVTAPVVNIAFRRWMIIIPIVIYFSTNIYTNQIARVLYVTTLVGALIAIARIEYVGKCLSLFSYVGKKTLIIMVFHSVVAAALQKVYVRMVPVGSILSGFVFWVSVLGVTVFVCVGLDVLWSQCKLKKVLFG